MTPQQRERYLRHILLKEVGAQGQQKLLAARVCVVGAGGIGAPLLLYLAAAGVGALRVIDDDVVALSNLQRQILYENADIGAPKGETAARRLAARNPDASVDARAVRLDASNAPDLIAGCDLVIEGVDDFGSRFAVNAACARLGAPLLSVAIGRFHGQMALFKPYADPGRLPCYQCFVPEAPPREAIVNCEEEGVLGPLAGVMGALAAMEALKTLLGLGEDLAGRLFLYDALSATSRTVALPADPACPVCAAL